MKNLKRILGLCGMASTLLFASDCQAQFGQSSRSDVRYNWRTGRWEFVQEQQTLAPSAIDPNRNVVDPGSYQVVNEYYTANGVRYRRFGTRWTSYGVPHGNIQTQRVGSLSPGVDIRDQKGITYFAPGGGSGGFRPVPQSQPASGSGFQRLPSRPSVSGAMRRLMDLRTRLRRR